MQDFPRLRFVGLFFAVLDFAAAQPLVWVTDSLAKVQPDSSPGAATAIALTAARNEFESFQVHVRAGDKPVEMNLSVSDLVNARTGQTLPAARNVAVFREGYVNVKLPSDANGITGQVPDPLIPVRDAYFHEPRNAFPVTVPPGSNQSAWIDVFVPPGTPWGIYSGNVTVLDRSSTLAVIPVELTVWNITLPSTATLKSAFGLSYPTFGNFAYGGYAGYGKYPGAKGNSETGIAMMHAAVAQFFLDHRVTVSQVVPFGTKPQGGWGTFDAIYGPLFDGTAGTELQGARMTTINYASYPPEAADLADWQSHFSQKGWLSRLFTYICDEPPSGCTWNSLVSDAALSHASAPKVSTLVTVNLEVAAAQGVLESIDILTPLVDNIQPKDQPSLRPAYDAWLARPGKQLWWYQSCNENESCVDGIPGPASATWPTYTTDSSPVRNRIFQWMAFLYRVAGELYYSTDDWTGSPWVSSYRYGGNGGGVLYYPGTSDQIGGTTPVPVASLRLKLIRDGMEDYEYLNALSEAGYDDLARALSAIFISNAYTFSNDPQQLQGVRRLIGAILHQLSLLPAPFSISGCAPSSFVAKSGDVLLTVNGAGFQPGDVVRWSSPDSGSEVSLPTVYVSSGQLTAMVSGSYLTSPGTATIVVRRNVVQAASTTAPIR